MNADQRVYHLRLVLEDDAEEFAYSLHDEGCRRSEVEDLTRDWIQNILNEAAKVGQSNSVLWEFVDFPTKGDVDALMKHVMDAYDENIAYEKKKSASCKAKPSTKPKTTAKKPAPKRKSSTAPKGRSASRRK